MEDNISPRDRRDANAGRSVELSARTLQRLEALRQLLGRQSMEELIEEAVAVYARLRSAREVAAFKRLTPRLREVLRMIGEGDSTKEIAYQLKVTAKTVEYHRARLMKRLGIRDIAGLVRFAIRVGAVLP
jgi:DNA-binding NarL/FixJ family response regulator